MIIAVGLHRVTGLRAWAAALLVLIWMGTEVATRRRRYYTSESAERRIVFECGVAVSSLRLVRAGAWEVVAARTEDSAAIQLPVRGINGLEEPGSHFAPLRFT